MGQDQASQAPPKEEVLVSNPDLQSVEGELMTRENLPQMEKLNSIRDLMNHDRVFDMESLAGSFRDFAASFRDLLYVLETEDEFDGEMFAGELSDLNESFVMAGIPTIDLFGKQESAQSLHLTDNDESGDPAAPSFTDVPGFRADSNQDFNPFELIDKRRKAAKAKAFDAFFPETFPSPSHKQTDFSYSSDESSSTAELRVDPNDTKDSSPKKSPRRLRSFSSSEISNKQMEKHSERGETDVITISREVTEPPTIPRRTARRPRSRGLNAAQVIQEHLERLQKDHNVTPDSCDVILKVQEVISKHLEQAKRTSSPSARAQEQGPSSSSRQTTRRRRSKGLSDQEGLRLEHESCDTHEEISKHLETRVERTASPSARSSEPTSSSPSRQTTRRRRSKGLSDHERLRPDDETCEAHEVISKHLETRVERTASPSARSSEPTSSSPSRQTTRRRRSSATKGLDDQEGIRPEHESCDAHEVISKHLEASVERTSSPSARSSEPASSSPSRQAVRRQRSSVSEGPSNQERVRPEHESCDAQEAISKHLEARVERKASPSSRPKSSSPSRRTILHRRPEHESSTSGFCDAQEVISKHLELQVKKAVSAPTNPSSERRSPTGRTIRRGRSSAAEVLTEHTERLQPERESPTSGFRDISKAREVIANHLELRVEETASESTKPSVERRSSAGRLIRRARSSPAHGLREHLDQQERAKSVSASNNPSIYTRRRRSSLSHAPGLKEHTERLQLKNENTHSSSQSQAFVAVFDGVDGAATNYVDESVPFANISSPARSRLCISSRRPKITPRRLQTPLAFSARHRRGEGDTPSMSEFPAAPMLDASSSHHSSNHNLSPMHVSNSIYTPGSNVKPPEDFDTAAFAALF